MFQPLELECARSAPSRGNADGVLRKQASAAVSADITAPLVIMLTAAYAGIACNCLAVDKASLWGRKVWPAQVGQKLSSCHWKKRTDHERSARDMPSLAPACNIGSSRRCTCT